MTVVLNDSFGSYAAPPTSGAAGFTTDDNVESVLFMDYFGSPAAGDKVEFTLTFPAGTITFRARWSTTSTLILERESTIPGAGFGTATLQTFTTTSTNKPRTTGDIVRMGIILNRAGADGFTAVTMRWHGRSNFSSAGTTNTFTAEGELTPTDGSFAITGSSFRNRRDLIGTATMGGSWVEAQGRHAQNGNLLTDLFESFGLLPGGGASPLRPLGQDVARVVDPGVDLGGMIVRASATCDPGKFPLLYLLGRWNKASKTGLFAYISYPDIAAIGSCTNGVYDGDYDSVTIPSLDDGAPHQIEFVIYDDPAPFADILIDGISAFPAPLDISFGSGAAVTSGTAGVGGTGDSADDSGLLIHAWEVDDEPGIGPDPGEPPPPPVFPDPTPPNGPQTTVAIDHFTGSVDFNIGDPVREADGVAFPASGASCYKAGKWAVIREFTASGDIAPVTQVDIPDWRDAIWHGISYGVVSSYFTAQTELQMLSWENVHPGDLLIMIGYSRNGTKTPTVPAGWIEKFNQNAGSFQGHLVVCSREVEAGDPTLWTMQFPGPTDLANERFCAQIIAFRQASVAAVTLGTSWLSHQDYPNIDPEGLTGDDNSVLLTIAGKRHRQRMCLSGQRPHLMADQDFVVCGWASSTAAQVVGAPGGVSEMGPGVSIVSAWHKGPTSAPSHITIEDRVLGGPPYAPTEGAGQGVVLKLALASLPANPPAGHATERMYTLPDPYPSGAPIVPQAVRTHVAVLHDIAALGSVEDGPIVEGYSVEAKFDMNDRPSSGSNGMAVCALMDPVYGLGYSFMFRPGTGVSLPGSNDPIFQFRHWGTGVPLADGPAPDIPAGTPVVLRLCITGTLPNSIIEFKGYLNDILLFEVSHLFDTTSYPIEANPMWPGIMMETSESYNAGHSVNCDYVRVSLGCDSPYPTECNDCTGDPDGPWPYPNPPPIPQEGLYNIYGKGKFREIIRLQEWRNGRFHDIYGEQVPETPLNFQARGKFRPVIFFDGETVPEPETPGPVHWDPCLLVPPLIPPGELFPLAGRFFGMSNTPDGALQAGSVFTGNQDATGPWIMDAVAFLAPLGKVLIGAQGGGSLIKLNNQWHLPTFLNGTRTKLNSIWPAIIPYLGTTFFGYSMADDVTSENLWGPGGVDLVEFASAVATIQSEYPGLPLGARMRPSQVSFNPGLNFYYCQYSAERGDPGTFATTEYALCQARGAYLVVCLNYLHGGDGRSGVRYANGTHKGQSVHNWMCSAEEVVEYFTAMYNAIAAIDPSGANLPGSLGYQYNTTFLALPDMPTALMMASNALATTFPPL